MNKSFKQTSTGKPQTSTTVAQLALGTIHHCPSRAILKFPFKNSRNMDRHQNPISCC